jgi:hypothetical protein
MVMGVTVGVVTGQSIEAYRGGDTVRLVKVQLLGNFPETIEWFDIAGEDTAPIIGDKVVVLEVARNYKIAIATKDLITAAVNAGERKFFSRNAAGVVQATIYLKDDGIIEINGNINTAVKYAPLNTALQGLVTAINNALTFKQDATGQTPGSLTLDITAAEEPTVKLP